ncbi:DUF5518 domain-containing protein [Methanobacterium sp. ACI-7]|uniref:DUF5518 domain-containing protein n=1 Tax=unclassified Methanobacterium TaxID=2627676 RepID=UPI0039C0A47C
MINWKTILIGSGLALILGFTLSLFLPLGNLIGYFTAALYVGYTVGGENRNGAIHGAIVGFIAGIIAIITNLIQLSSIQLEAFIGGELVLFVLILLIGIIFAGIIGAFGGFLGAFKRSRSSNEDI